MVSGRYNPGYGPISDAEALKRVCPLCEAPPSKPCTYVWPKNVGATYRRSARAHELVARVGTPTDRPHNARRY